MASPLSWVISKVKLLNDAIWHTSLSDISKGKSFLFRQLRIIVLAARGFLNDKVQLRAASLTLYSLLSIIPVAAIAFAIAKGFGLDQNLKDLLAKEFQTQPEVLNWVLNEASVALQETRGGYIAGIGVIILIWSVMSLLDQIESSFNHIWQISSGRPWYRKFTDYITIMLIAPVFLILSSSITVLVSTSLSDLIAKSSILDSLKPLVSFLIKFAPYILTWIALTILFMIMPNTKVKFKPALVSGIVAGTILQILQWLYIDLQFGISKLSSIYGSFAAIPLFIIWLQSSWIILLLGAELSFANQNVSRYEFESESLNVSQHQKRALSLMIMNMIVRNFSAGDKPVSAEMISSSLKIPVRLVRDLLEDLNKSGLVSVIHENEHKEWLYQPAMDINRLSVSFILKRLDNKGSEHMVFSKSKEYDKVNSMLEKYDRIIAESESNILVKDLF
ncbi:MAG TPA: YihY/virulence factor BrkB family protein [Bacteroidales bacterium]|jgi:membrane protein|nr:YihY/virulence factor BrkB family protein [Bacteroidales bacterium]